MRVACISHLSRSAPANRREDLVGPGRSRTECCIGVNKLRLAHQEGVSSWITGYAEGIPGDLIAALFPDWRQFNQKTTGRRELASHAAVARGSGARFRCS